MFSSKRNQRVFWWVLIAAAVIAAAGVFSYRLQQRRPNDVLAQTIRAVESADSWHMKTELALHLPERRRNGMRPFTEVIAFLEGDLKKGAKESQFVGNISAEAHGVGNSFFADGALNMYSDAVAFKLNSLPILLNKSGNLINKWTYVDASLLGNNNADKTKEALRKVINKMTYEKKEKVDGKRTMKFIGSLSADEEKMLSDALSVDSSHNELFGIVARLLNANNVKGLAIWIDPKSNEIVQSQVDFVRPLSNGRTYDFASLRLAITDYGKSVKIEQPTKELSVKPEIFANLFNQ